MTNFLISFRKGLKISWPGATQCTVSFEGQDFLQSVEGGSIIFDNVPEEDESTGILSDSVEVRIYKGQDIEIVPGLFRRIRR